MLLSVLMQGLVMLMTDNAAFGYDKVSWSRRFVMYYIWFACFSSNPDPVRRLSEIVVVDCGINVSVIVDIGTF